jgi:hypothetical protein
MTIYASHIVRLEDNLQIIFEKLKPVWFGRMWHTGEDSCHEMIDLIYEFYVAQEDW